MRARIAWVLAGLTAAMTVVDIAVTAAYRPLLSEEAVAQHGFPFVNAAVLGSAVLGALVISRDHRHVVGWLLNLIGVIGAFSLMLEAYSIWVVSDGGPGSTAVAGVLGLTASVVGGQFAIGGLALLFLLAPDGRLLSPRWRYVAALVPIGVLCCAISLLSGDPREFDIQGTQVGPVREGTFTLGFALISLGLVGAVISMLVRLRRSRGEERQQVRLIALAVGLLMLGIVSLFVLQSLNGGRQTWAASLPLYVAYMVLPLALGVAVLRYRLYDVGLFINRAAVLAIGTAFAAVGYVVLVVVVGGQVDSRTGGFAVSLLGTAVVALAFQPLRRWVVHLANRLAYGHRARPYVALSDFSSRLVVMPTADALLPAVADAAGRAVSARGASVVLDVPGADAVSADWGDAERGTTLPYDVPIRTSGAVLGHITVLVPKGRAVRAAEARLLQALADQTAVAFRNIAMEAELAVRVAALDRTTDELADSRARLIDADDAARRTLEAAIARDVFPRLVTLPAELARAGRAIATGSGDHGLDVLVRDTNTALESLRGLTRGVFPTQLARTGLEPALRSCLARSGLGPALQVHPGAAGQRFSRRIEAAVYFCCAEAARALSEHASVSLGLDGADLVLRVTGITDDRMDWLAIEDRVAAVDGTLTREVGGMTVVIPGASAAVAVGDVALGGSTGGPRG